MLLLSSATLTKPQVTHASRHNAVVRYAQRNEKGAHRTPPSNRSRQRGSRDPLSWPVVVVPDSCLKKEDTDGHAMRGLFVLVVGGGSDTHIRARTVYLLDSTAQDQHHVSRSTLAVELLAARDGAHQAHLIAHALHQLHVGCRGVADGRRRHREGGLAVKTWHAIGAMSVYAAVSAEAVKIPTEKSLLSHVQWLRELADRGLLTGIAWVDTRVMLADVLTKGSVERALLYRAVNGHWALQYEPSCGTAHLPPDGRRHDSDVIYDSSVQTMTCSTDAYRG